MKRNILKALTKKETKDEVEQVLKAGQYRPPTKMELTIFSYLDTSRQNYLTLQKGLRWSTPDIVATARDIIENEFGRTDEEAKYLSKLWIINHNKEGDYKLIKTR